MSLGLCADLLPVGYNLDRKPATWVMAQSARRERVFWFGAVAALLLSLAIVIGALEGFKLGVTASIAILVVVLLVRPFALRWTDRHFRLLRGAVSERDVGETLNELLRERWSVMHDIKRASDAANIDHLVSGPNGVYLIETKHRRYEKQALPRVKRQAARVHDEIGIYVTPVICIDAPRKKPFQHEKVWIVPHAQLLDWLRQQRNKPVEFERLARFADAVVD